MRVFWLGPLWLLLGVAPVAFAQSAAPSQAAPPEQPSPPEPAPEPAPPEPPALESPAPAESPVSEAVSAPEPSATPERVSGSPLPEHEPGRTIAPTAQPVWVRAHAPLTLEPRLGFSFRPESASGFDNETVMGSELGLSLYYELARELAAGIEVDHVGLGRGTALTGLSSVSVDYTVTSAMLGFRAYPYRRELFDVFVGLQLGVGLQGISATGTSSGGSVVAAPVPYACDATDSPALQLGGGIGARLMLAPRFGVSARINAALRRLSSDVIDDCARGLGSATTVGASLGIGYDFDLDP